MHRPYKRIIQYAVIPKYWVWTDQAKTIDSSWSDHDLKLIENYQKLLRILANRVIKLDYTQKESDSLQKSLTRIFIPQCGNLKISERKIRKQFCQRRACKKSNIKRY